MWRPTHRADPAARAARIVTIVATVVFALVVTRWRPWDLFDRAGFSTDFYDEQARSFLRLRLAVRPEVADHEGFLVDGKTYLYYGPFLALARLPFALFGDAFAGRLTRISMIAGYVALCTASFHLVQAALRRFARPAGTGGPASPWRVAGFVAAAACSPVLFLPGWVSVYHETELWAAVFALCTAVGVLRLLDEPSRRTALLTGGAIVAAILTRASVGIGLALGACAAVASIIWSRIVTGSVTRRDQNAAAADGDGADGDGSRGGGRADAGWRGAVTVVGAAATGFVLHGALNRLRFGSPTRLPAEQQVLSLRDPVRAAWFAGNDGSFFSLRFLPTTVVHYLRPDTVRFERLFPFVRYGPLAVDRGSYPLETITPAGSITATATLLTAAAVVGLVVIVRHRAWAWLALFGGACLAALPTFTIGFIGNRYLVDMLPMLMIPAAAAFAATPVPSDAWRTIARLGLVVLVAWGTWANVALATWTQNLKEPGFTAWRYRVDGWIFADPAPALVDLDPTAPVPRDGVVALAPGADGNCESVYIAEQGSWVVLERHDGSRQLTGSLTIDGDETDVGVVFGDTWGITATAVSGAHGDELTFRATGDGLDVTGEPLPFTPGAPLAVRVVADEINHELSVTVDDDLALFSFAVPSLPMVPAERFQLATPDVDDDSLCTLLAARR